MISKKKKKVFTEIARGFPAEIRISSGFSGQKHVFSKIKKKRSSSQKRHKIWCQSPKNTNLDLDLRSRSHEPVNFFGAQSSLGGAQFLFGGTSSQLGGHGRGLPPRGAGSGSQEFAMRGGLFGGSGGEAPSCRRLGIWEQISFFGKRT